MASVSLLSSLADSITQLRNSVMPSFDHDDDNEVVTNASHHGFTTALADDSGNDRMEECDDDDAKGNGVDTVVPRYSLSVKRPCANGKKTPCANGWPCANAHI